ncbi:MAG: hypothetical protein OXG82_17460, partial [Gammaproteobacteria bacterium]|nr:hypothetical protein [Gammaproteobacteria bacterium]
SGPASARGTARAGLSTPCPWRRSPSIQEARWARGGQPHADIEKGDVLQAASVGTTRAAASEARMLRAVVSDRITVLCARCVTG